MKQYFLTYDIISSGIKTSVFTVEGDLVSHSYRPLVQHFSGNRAEEPVESWIDGMKATTAEAMTGIRPEEVKAISFTAMSQVCLCVDRDGRPLHEAFTWSDTRSEEAGDPIGVRYSQKEVYEMTGLRNTPMSSIRKFYWIKQNWPQIYEKTWKMIQCKDYLAYCLTGQVYTDYSDASSTGALDVKKRCWSAEILDCVGIDAAKLPDIAESNQVIGTVTETAATAYGLHAGIPVTIGAGDILCSAVGAGCIHDRDVYMSLGSSSWVACCMDEPRLDDEMRSSINPHAIPGKYLGFVNYQTAGVVFKWLKNEVFRYDENGAREIQPYKNVFPYKGMEEQVRQSPVGANGLLFLPHVLEADPAHPETYARGAYIGCDWRTTREDMMRAALEGVCFELRRFVEMFCGEEKPAQVTITGIASHELYWLQMIADVLGVPVKNTNLHDTPDSIGAAVIAGQGVGIYPDFAQANFFRNFENVFQPNKENVEKYEKIYKIYLDAYSGIEKTLERMEMMRK